MMTVKSIVERVKKVKKALTEKEVEVDKELETRIIELEEQMDSILDQLKECRRDHLVLVGKTEQTKMIVERISSFVKKAARLVYSTGLNEKEIEKSIIHEGDPF